MSRGLAQDFGFDQAVNDLRYNQQLKKQATQLAEQQAKLFADDFQYNNAMNSFDNPRVKALAQNKIKEIGKFVNENPDWKTNITKRTMYSNMVHDLKDNPELNRGLISDKNFQEFQKDMAEKIKNPGLYDAEAYDSIKSQWDNYNRFGNQFGEEAAKKEGIRPFQYQAPLDFVDLAKVGLDYGNKFNDFTHKKIKGGLGAYEEVPKEESLNAVTIDLYKRHERQLNKEAQKFGVNPIEYAKNLISAGIKKKTDDGDWGALIAMGKWREEKNGQKVPIEGSHTKDITKSVQSVVNGAVLKDSYGTNMPTLITSDDGKKTIDLTGIDFDYTGLNRYKDGKVPTVKGNEPLMKDFQIVKRIPISQAQELGILSNNFIGDDEISPEWKKKAKLETVTNKSGEEKEYVSIVDFIPVNINTTSFQQAYDQKVSPTKFVENPKDSYQTTKKVIQQNGVTYTLNEKTGQYE